MNNRLNNLEREQLLGMFTLEFMSGVIFSYSGFLGFFAGTLTGIIVANKVELSASATESLTRAINQLKLILKPAISSCK